jgi:predicted  nucleic acid-binding Zn-ribbon protein
MGDELTAERERNAWLAESFTQASWRWNREMEAERKAREAAETAHASIAEMYVGLSQEFTEEHLECARQETRAVAAEAARDELLTAIEGLAEQALDERRRRVWQWSTESVARELEAIIAKHRPVSVPPSGGEE